MTGTDPADPLEEEEAEEAPSFPVTYLSPVDPFPAVSLTCKESLDAYSTASCTGNYTTEPLENVKAGFGVNIECEIKFGARSGPECVTKLTGTGGPNTQNTYVEHLNPPPGKGLGPVSLKSWDQEYLNFLKVENPELHKDLTSPTLTNPPTLTSSGADMSPSEDPSPGVGAAEGETTPSADQTLLAMLKRALNKVGGVAKTPQATPPLCTENDYKCKILRREMLSPPTTLQVVTAPIADLCSPSSLCASWKHFRQYVSNRFVKKLTNGSFRLDAFKSDEGSLWSTQGAKLWADAQKVASDDQRLGSAYLSQLQYKSTLTLLAEVRNTRLELLDNSTSLFIYTFGLGVPGVLLTIVYMSITCRTWYKTKLNTRLRKRFKREEEQAILKAARPGMKLRMITSEQDSLLDDGKPSRPGPPNRTNTKPRIL